jgi:hypothetical protein
MKLRRWRFNIDGCAHFSNAAAVNIAPSSDQRLRSPFHALDDEPSLSITLSSAVAVASP